jgi:hypothetical protein
MDFNLKTIISLAILEFILSAFLQPKINKKINSNYLNLTISIIVRVFFIFLLFKLI